MENNNEQGLKVDLKNTQMIKDKDGDVLFMPGYILRKVSKFVTGNSEDTAIPVQVWFNPKTGKVLEEGLPTFIVDELKELDRI